MFLYPLIAISVNKKREPEIYGCVHTFGRSSTECEISFKNPCGLDITSFSETKTRAVYVKRVLVLFNLLSCKTVLWFIPVVLQIKLSPVVLPVHDVVSALAVRALLNPHTGS